jgi:hypothetical protein
MVLSKPAPSTGGNSLQKDKTANAAAEVSPALDAVTRMEAKNAPTIPQPVPMQKQDAFAANQAAAPSPANGVVAGVMSAEATAERDRVEVPQTNSTDSAKLNSTVGAALPSAYGGAVARKKAVMAPAWRVTLAGTLEHWTRGEWKTLSTTPDDVVVAVTNFGPNVWAAAGNLQLYHSGDDGRHWELQPLPQEARGEITALAFTSALDGALRTNTGQAWSTHDGGKTWASTNLAP